MRTNAHRVPYSTNQRGSHFLPSNQTARSDPGEMVWFRAKNDRQPPLFSLAFLSVHSIPFYHTSTWFPTPQTGSDRLKPFQTFISSHKRLNAALVLTQVNRFSPAEPLSFSPQGLFEGMFWIQHVQHFWLAVDYHNKQKKTCLIHLQWNNGIRIKIHNSLAESLATTH